MDGRPVHVGSRAYDVLTRPRPAQRQAGAQGASFEAAWPGLVVEENNVSVQVAALRKLLGAQAIATVPGVGYQLSAPPALAVASDRLADDGSGDDAAGAASRRGPAGVALVGRETEIEELVARTGSVPLLSITGTGGVGKTSLARAILARQESGWRDGVHWIDLAPLRDGAQLPKLIAASLGIELEGSARAEEDLISALAHLRALIAVDNCEHLLTPVAAFIGAAIERASSVRWLATPAGAAARHRRIRLPAGAVSEVPPARRCRSPMPCAGGARWKLLCQRAAANDQQFRLDASNVATAVDLCRQLDGLPLAIEMSAARVASLGLDGVYEQLGQRLRLLAGPRAGPARHHTLRSIARLELRPAAGGRAEGCSGAAGTLRRRLPQRHGAAPGVCDLREDEAGGLVGWNVLEALSALVDKSLVHRSAEVPRRFFLFESAREYAAERLGQSGEAERVHGRYAQVVAEWSASARADQERLPNDQQWKARWATCPSAHNVRAAFKWACERRRSDPWSPVDRRVRGRLDTFVQSNARRLVQCAGAAEWPCSIEYGCGRCARQACLELSWAHYLRTVPRLRHGPRVAGAGRLPGRSRHGRCLSSVGAADPPLRVAAGNAGAREAKLGRAATSRRPRRSRLRTRLFCTITAGLQYESIRPVARLEELEEMASRAGFQALAAICRVQITDRLLIAAQVRRGALASGAAGSCRRRRDCRLGCKALILNNKALALVGWRTSSRPTLRQPAALRALPSSSCGIVDTFALAATDEGRMVDAALMAGYAARVRRQRDESPDPAEADAIDDTIAALRKGLARERLDELMRAGASMSAADILALAMPST